MHACRGGATERASMIVLEVFTRISLQHAATCCNMLQHTVAHSSTLQHTAAHCCTLQHTAALQHAAV